MKAILISIKPKYVAKILNGKKTIEIRKTMPKCDLPIDVYIYCTKGKETIAINPYGGYATIFNKYKNEYFNGKVVAKFTLNKVEEITPSNLDNFAKSSCLLVRELELYLWSNICFGYAWYISNLVIFDRPKELSEFRYAVCPKTNCEYCEYNKTVEGDLYCTRKTLTKAPQSWCYVEVE